MSEIVDREAETKEESGSLDLVDRVGATEEAVEVDRTGSTQEDSGTKLIFHVQTPEKKSLLKGLPNEPQTYELGRTIIFGRGENVDIFLNDDNVSRQHMELSFILHEPTQQAVFKVKVISKKLTIKVNNDIVRYGGERYLRTNDVIVIGQLTFMAEIISGDESSSNLLVFKEYSSLNPVQLLQHPLYAPQLPSAQIYNPVQVPPYHPSIPDPNVVQVSPMPRYSGVSMVQMTVPAHHPVPMMQTVLSSSGLQGYPMQSNQAYVPLAHDQTASRERFPQTRQRIASENEDVVNCSVSVQETNQNELSSLGESFEDTHLPKE